MKQIKIIDNGLDAVKMFNDGYRKGIQKAKKEEVEFLENFLGYGNWMISMNTQMIDFNDCDICEKHYSKLKKRIEKLNKELK